MVASCVLILLMGRYKALDRLSKIIVISLSITTIAAVAIAVNKGMQMQEGFIEPSPWNLAALGFIIALMGWMPAPIEIAAIELPTAVVAFVALSAIAPPILFDLF